MTEEACIRWLAAAMVVAVSVFGTILIGVEGMVLENGLVPEFAACCALVFAVAFAATSKLLGMW